jgi:hypothetical protein
MAEALNGTYKAELVKLHGPWRTRSENPAARHIAATGQRWRWPSMNATVTAGSGWPPGRKNWWPP